MFLFCKGEFYYLKINSKVCIRNHQFWMFVIPVLALVIQNVAAVFGWSLDFTSLLGKLIEVMDVVFAMLVNLGIVVDPAIAGVSDSQRAMEYGTPWEEQN